MSGDAMELYDDFLSELGYVGSDGLTQLSTEKNVGDVNKVKKKIGIDAIYSGTENGNRTSLIYFKAFEHHSDHELRKLYQKVWNEGRASLLIVILSNEIRVYNPNASPLLSSNEELDSQQRLVDNINLRDKVLSQISEIEIYHRSYFDSKEYWRHKEDAFSKSGRVDQYLHNDLAALKEKLEASLGSSIANRLVIKSVFLLFLEHRGILSEEFFENHGIAGGYESVLPDKKDTYRLFELVEDELNGDVFKYDRKEREKVTEDDLTWILRFLQGEDINTGQKRLFPYSFDIIPVELISSIYEDFVPSENGVFYTPFYLVDFILDDFSEDSFDETSKILDPSCGSGVFLVNAFEKLIQDIQAEVGTIEPERLLKIARENIVGVDRNPEAVQITAFSLSLKILEYLDNGQGVEDIQLPNFVGESIFESDFFDSEPDFNDHLYDFIVGNPPWIKETDSLGQRYCDKTNRATGNNQLAIPFLWKSLDLLSQTGDACLLVPTRDMLLNKHTRDFRRDFFEEAQVESIINLTILRKRLFENSDNPCSIIKFTKEREIDKKIQYITPSIQKPELLQTIWVSPDDIKYLDGSEFDELVWKAAMYGETQDIELIRRLSDKSTIQDYIDENELTTREGFQVGGPKETENSEIPQLPHIPTRRHQPYAINPQDLTEFDQSTFHRPRTGTSIWYGPRILVKEGITSTSFPHLRSAYIEDDATFRHIIMAIKGSAEDRDSLKALDLILNSNLAQYYFFMTSSNWGVERDIVEKYEIMNFPFPRDELPIGSLANLHDEITKSIIHEDGADQQGIQERAEEMIYDAYGLDEREKLLIESRVRNTIDLFNRKENSHALSPPNSSDVERYLEIVTDQLSTFLKTHNYVVSGRYYEEPEGLAKYVNEPNSHHMSPLNVVTLCLSTEGGVSVEKASTTLRKKLSDINDQVIGGSSSMFLQKREIYNAGSEVHVIKPNELRLWDPAAAINDISWLLGDLISGGDAK